ncbi:PD40 domain-containing protein [Hymenobacter sp. BRD128]|uniref:carboxypeptidase regulatory-like domain-containing protein n=1 Tax=Hymenobacter sp. BRD128 TaxID=2675878 RepID=UPI0015672646|nr:carboxypeptidase regulatory-like domain-containing protein [Hymenobacter sp. BRD128]QKG57094.1 PD40 domain-containing protein [Hymenobacter sp. BRD128]
MLLASLVRRHCPRSVLFVFSCLLGLAACEPNLVEPAYYGTLTVTVLDGSTSQPLANVAVSTTPATGSYVTDAKGQLTITQVPVGTLSVSARKAGYDATSSSATLTAGQTQSVVLLLNKTTASAPPGAPVRPTPTPGATAQPTTLQLAWHPAAGALPADSLKYDVVLYEGSNLNQRQLLTASKDTTVTASGLRYNTIYYWQVTVRNPAGATARGPVWSFQTVSLPDNRYLFARTVGGNTDIYSSDAAGTTVVRLTSAVTVETAPQLSPSRDLIAYSSNASGQFQLYTMNRDGSNQRRITTLSAEGYSNAGIGYRWSPDGSQLIYAHYDQLYRINRDGSGLVLLATAPAGRHFRECDWTAQNGGRLVVQTIGSLPYDAELYLYNVDGTGPVLLVGNLPGRLDSPSFSVDGTTVAYTRDVAGFNDVGGRQLDSHIFTQKLNGSSLVDVSSSTSGSTKATGTNDLTPRYSPTGYQLIFVNRSNDDIAAPQVWTCDLDGRNRTKLFDNAFLPDYR